MSSYKYDLHIHSCLSPCGDDDMTPANIAGLASLLGLNCVALTDHNTSKNCPAFFAHAKRYGIIPVAGMELTTAEEIHVICLFDTLEGAMSFDAEVEKHRFAIKNRPEIFGNQYIMDAEDNVCGTEENLLINATDLDIEAAYKLCTSLGGVCYPAHIDRDSGGMAAVLGTIPDFPPYSAFELNDKNNLEEYLEKFPILKEKKFIVSSDAHRLTSLSEGENEIELEDAPDDCPSVSAFVRKKLIEYLKAGEQT